MLIQAVPAGVVVLAVEETVQGQQMEQTEQQTLAAALGQVLQMVEQVVLVL